ncbi:hypothetical protein [Lacinutrix himadriensis]|uniref:hypothetical protein n=1 Tax=Lacinutrix himadriensis TaxID=641549 RepID=UPI0006E2E95E|nr:hypothetical protein [Lacinutrix himadriensis]
MLYIQFEIQNASKFEDFKNLYNHMVQVRQPGFKFDEEGPEFDWDTMSEEEVDAALKELNTFLDAQVEPEKYRYKALIPSYAKEFLENYIKNENEKSGYFGESDALPIFNYLEFGFEVDMDHLKKINEHSGIVEFSTGNYPFGGLERFIMTLAAYELKPVACFDGFNPCKIHWTSAFAYESIVSTKKNPFSRITEWISNSLFKKSLFLVLFLICNILSAQIDTSACVVNNKIIKTNTKDVLVLEKPEFPTPEDALLFFLSEDKILNPSNYKGDVIHLEKIYTEHTKTGKVVYADTIITKDPKSFKHFKELSEAPILDQLDIDNVIKIDKHTFQLQSTDSLYHLNVIYTLKNNKIIALTEDTSVYVNDVKYAYNKQGQLIKKSYFNEYGSGVMDEAIYNSNGQIISQSRFDNTDGLAVTIKTYTYNTNHLLTHLEMTNTLYFVPFENEGENIEINKVDYLKYKRPETYVNTHSISFEYNERCQLVKVLEERKGFTEENGIENQSKRLYELSYKPNQLNIAASLPEKRSYAYTFDVLENPKEINSFVVDADTTWLRKKTSFNILYNK